MIPPASPPKPPSLLFKSADHHQGYGTLSDDPKSNDKFTTFNDSDGGVGQDGGEDYFREEGVTMIRESDDFDPDYGMIKGNDSLLDQYEGGAMPGWLSVKPTIHLEVMSSGWVKFILGVVYLLLIVCIVFNFLEHGIHTENWRFHCPHNATSTLCMPRSGFPYRNTSAGHNVFSMESGGISMESEGMYAQTNASLVQRSSAQSLDAARQVDFIFDDTFHLQTIQLYFSLQLTLNRRPANKSLSAGSSGSFVTAATPVPGGNLPLNVSVVLQGYSSSHVTELYRQDLQLSLSCDAGNTEVGQKCAPLSVLTPPDYEYLYEDVGQYYEHFHVRLIFYGDNNLRDRGRLLMKYTYQATAFRYAAMALHSLLVGVTVIFALYFLYRVRKRGFSHSVPEQIWIILLFIALVMYQDPLFVPLLVRPLKIYREVSATLYFVAQGYILCFWLLMMDGIRATKDKFELAQAYAPSASICLVDERGQQAYKYRWGFYTWKVVLCVFSVGVAIPMSLLNENPLIHIDVSSVGTEGENAVESYKKNNQFRTVFIFVCTILYALTLVIWFVWMLRSTWKGHSYLRKLPYLATRYRQLAFRFFLLQAWCIILYFAFVAIGQLASGKKSGFELTNDGARTGFLSTAVLISIYIYTLAFVYLPVQPAVYDEDATQADKSEGLLEGNLESSVSCDDDSMTLYRQTHRYEGPHIPLTGNLAKLPILSMFLKEDPVRSLRIRCFSLKIARMLCDFALQAYYQPPLRTRSDQVVQIKVFGFESEADEGEFGDEKKAHEPVIGYRPPGAEASRGGPLVISTGGGGTHSAPTMRTEGDSGSECDEKTLVVDTSDEKTLSEGSSTVENSTDEKNNTPHTQNVLVAVTNKVREWVDLYSLGWRLATIASDDNEELFGYVAELRDASSESQSRKSQPVRRQSLFSPTHDDAFSSSRTQQQHSSTLSLPSTRGVPAGGGLVETSASSARRTRNEPRRQIIVAFRGTCSWANLKADLRFGRTQFVIPHAPVPEVGMVHKGFLQAYSSIRDPVIAGVRACVERTSSGGHTRGFSGVGLTESTSSRNMQQPVDIMLTGHSLGGALATLCAYELQVLFGNRVACTVYTYGCPRVGDRAFAAFFDRMIPRCYRIVNDRDPVTRLPKVFCFYKHVGMEVVIDRAGNLVVDPSWVEKTFRSARFSLAAMKDHGIRRYIEGLNAVLREVSLEADVRFRMALDKQNRNVSYGSRTSCSDTVTSSNGRVRVGSINDAPARNLVSSGRTNSGDLAVERANSDSEGSGDSVLWETPLSMPAYNTPVPANRVGHDSRD